MTHANTKPGVANISRTRTTISLGQLAAMDSCFGLLGLISMAKLTYQAGVFSTPLKHDEKKVREDEQPLAEISSGHRHSSPFAEPSLVSLYGRILKSVVCTDSSVCTHYLGQDSPIQTSCSVNKS